ncbi:hypothetical protein Tco_1135297 [Tanacetum coccineum]
MYKEYYPTSSQEVSDNSAANTLDNDHTSSSSSIVIDQDDPPQIVSSSEEQVVTEPNSPVLNEVANDFVQEDVAYFDGTTFHNAPQTPEFDVTESSLTYQDPSNMHQFHQQHRLIDRWTRNHLLEQVIISTIEPKIIKEAMLDHSWFESMQDELNQFKRLDVWELVKCPVGRNIIKEGIDFEESFAPVARLEAPDGFVDPDFPNHVYRLKKGLYGLKQAPRAWSTKPVFAKRFEKLMKDNFEMSMIGVMKFFLILQAHQSPRDADHAGYNDDCKTTSGGIQFLGDKLVSWSSKKQDCTTMSSAEADYHFIKEHVEKGTIELYFVGREYQLADLFTKALSKERFEFLVHKIGVRCMTPTQLERLAKLSS